MSRRQPLRMVPPTWSRTAKPPPSKSSHRVLCSLNSLSATTMPRLRSVIVNVSPGSMRNAGNWPHSAGTCACTGSTGGKPWTAVTRSLPFD